MDLMLRDIEKICVIVRGNSRTTLGVSFGFRLKSSPSNKYFPAMDEKYILGIPEIDAQHEEISEFIDSFRQVIAQKDQRHLVHQALKRLHQTLVNHFDHEEALMGMVNYPGLSQHKQTHKGVLKLFDDYFDHPPAPIDYEYFGKMISDRVLAHVMEHDLKMTDSVRQYLSEQSTNCLPKKN